MGVRVRQRIARTPTRLMGERSLQRTVIERARQRSARGAIDCRCIERDQLIDGRSNRCNRPGAHLASRVPECHDDTEYVSITRGSRDYVVITFCPTQHRRIGVPSRNRTQHCRPPRRCRSFDSWQKERERVAILVESTHLIRNGWTFAHVRNCETH